MKRFNWQRVLENIDLQAMVRNAVGWRMDKAGAQHKPKVRSAYHWKEDHPQTRAPKAK